MLIESRFRQYPDSRWRNAYGAKLRERTDATYKKYLALAGVSPRAATTSRDESPPNYYTPKRAALPLSAAARRVAKLLNWLEPKHVFAGVIASRLANEGDDWVNKHYGYFADPADCLGALSDADKKWAIAALGASSERDCHASDKYWSSVRSTLALVKANWAAIIKASFAVFHVPTISDADLAYVIK